MTADTSQLLTRFSRTARPPDPIRRHAETALWSSTARAAQASPGPKVEALRSTLQMKPTGSAVRVPGLDARVGAADAALIVAFAARQQGGDASGLAETVTGVTLALGQVIDASLTEAVDALAVGLEVGFRFARAFEWETTSWDPTGFAGPVAGACSALRLLNPPEGRAEQVLGIAATQGAGLQAGRTTDAWALHAGKAAANAVEAALLQDAGFTGPRRGIAGRRGLLPVAAPGVDLEGLTDALGSTWEVDCPAEGGDVPDEVTDLFARPDANLDELLNLATQGAADTS